MRSLINDVIIFQDLPERLSRVDAGLGEENQESGGQRRFRATKRVDSLEDGPAPFQLRFHISDLFKIKVDSVAFLKVQLRTNRLLGLQRRLGEGLPRLCGLRGHLAHRRHLRLPR